MIKIDRSRKQPPDGFMAMAEVEAQRAREFFKDPNANRMTFDFKAYLDPELREALLDLFHGKCAFCETPMQESNIVRIEHLRPRQMAINLDGEVTTPGYWWLGAEWANLYPICSSCNRSKGNRFPVVGSRAAYEEPGVSLFKLSIPTSENSKGTSAAPVIAIATADEKNQLYALQADGTILIFDLAGRRWMRNNRLLRRDDERFTCLTCDARGETILAGTESGKVFLWQASAASGFSVPGIYNQPVTALKITPDGAKAAIGYADGMVSTWERDRDPRDMLVPGHIKAVRDLAITVDGKQMISAGEDGALKIWDITDLPSVLFERNHDYPLAGVALSRDGKKAVMLGEDGLLKVWETTKWTVSYYFTNDVKTPGFHSLSISGDARYASSFSGERLYLFDLYLQGEITPGKLPYMRKQLGIIPGDGRSVICLDPENNLEAFGLNNLADEKALLIDPCQEDPEKVLIFQEDGLVVSIPAYDEPGQPAQSKDGSPLDRGQITIDVFGLNRAGLVEDRHALAASLREEMAIHEKELQVSPDSEKILSWLEDQFGDHQPYAALRRQVLGPLMEKLEIPELLQGTLDISPEIQQNISQSVAQNVTLESQKGVQKERLEKRASFSVESTHETESDKVLFFLTSALVDEIHVENYRPITELKFRFGSGRSELDQVGWKVLLGENAVGKSSLLEAVAFALMGPKRFAELVKTENLDPTTFLHRGKNIKQGSVRIYFSGDPDPVVMKLTKEGVEFSDSNPRLRTYLLGFGPARWLPLPGSQDPESDSFVRVRNLFNPFVPLTDALDWLPELQKKISKKEYSRVEDVLARMLLEEPGTRFPEHKGAIYIVPPNQRVSSRCKRLNELSDGYQTILAIAAAIIQMLGERWKYEMRAAEGLVLLDEIGEHLHPTWKMHIVESLRSAFPRMQFLATTHDPLCLRGLEKGEVVVLQRDDSSKVIALTELPSPADFRVDQLLTSSFFGLNSTIDPETERIFDEYYSLLAKEPRDEQENIRLESLKNELRDRRHLGNTLREELMYEVLDKLLAMKKFKEPRKEISEIKEQAIQQISDIWNRVVRSDN